MATVIDPNTAIQKKVNVSINGEKSFTEEVFFLEIWSTGNVTSQKTLEVKGEDNRSGAFKQVQLKFDKNSNYIYTKSDINQKKFNKTYKGTASEFSLSGLLADNTNTIIRISKTNSANDVPEMYNGLAERVELKVEPSDGLEPEPRPEPEGSSTTKDGVTVPVKIKSAWKYTVKEDWRDGGARFNMPGAGTSIVMVGYFTASQDKGDEVSGKHLMGRHTGKAGEPESYMGCGYDYGVPVGGGKPRMRAECPHPKYTDSLPGAIVEENALSFVGKWRGMMSIVTQEQAGVRIEVLQDQGDCETKPANQWVKIYEYLDDGKVAKIKKSGLDLKMFPIRNLDHTKGTAQNVWRIDNTPGLNQKWCAVAEIEGKNA